MQLVVCHYHWRAGGVRSVVERGLRSLLKYGEGREIRRVVLVSGEEPPREWMERVRRESEPVEVDAVWNIEAGYVSELQRQPRREEVAKFLERVIQKETRAVWVQNPSLARNPQLVEQVIEAATAVGAPVVFHHHDFWCDNRWGRWAEMQKFGHADLEWIGNVVFSGRALHACLTRWDTNLLKESLGERVFWLPNPLDWNCKPTEDEVAKARNWIWREIGADCRKGIWLMPGRVLRRKNVLEAIALWKELSGRGILFVPGVCGSGDETRYWQAIEQLASASQFSLRILPCQKRGEPRFWALIAAADALVLPSLVEGFGLAFLESAAIGRPLFCRRLRNVEPDLLEFGFTYPNSYREVMVRFWGDFGRREAARQRRMWEGWRRSIPPELWRWVPQPPVVHAEGHGWIAFSRLTFQGQLEALELAEWFVDGLMERQAVNLEWPEGAGELSGERFAKSFWTNVLRYGEICGQEKGGCGFRAQSAVIRDRLSEENMYPLLWSSENSFAVQAEGR